MRRLSPESGPRSKSGHRRRLCAVVRLAGGDAMRSAKAKARLEPGRDGQGESATAARPRRPRRKRDCSQAATAKAKARLQRALERRGLALALRVALRLQLLHATPDQLALPRAQVVA